MGKGTPFVPAAHGGRCVSLPDPEGVERSGAFRVLIEALGLRSRRFDPYRVEILFATWSVGGGHKPRALAHGY